MSTHVDIRGFHKGEIVQITFHGKNRDYSPLGSPELQTISFTLSPREGAPADFVWSTDSGNITLIEANASIWDITLTPTELEQVRENVTYYYNIWSSIGVHTNLLQAHGLFRLENSVEPV